MTTDRKLIDISVPIKSGMVHWPGDPDVEISQMLDMQNGNLCNVTALSMGSHTGTHMDAPLHFIKGGKTFDQFPLEATIGTARVIEINDRLCVRAGELKRHRIRKGQRILFKTRNSARSWKSDQFDERFIYIAKDAAEYLAERKVRTVGIDYLSVGGFRNDMVETHVALLGAGIWIIEGLNLSKVSPGRYELICLPLKIIGNEGAPARAVLKTLAR